MEKMIIDGYEFASAREAKLAMKEKNAVERIKAGVDINNTEKLYETYNKLVSKNYFSTPVGLSFLGDMREYLMQFYDEQRLRPIVVHSKNAQNDEIEMLQFNNKQLEKLSLENERLGKLVKKLVIAVVAMAIVIIGMTFIVVTNENLGYFNAEEKVLNKYAAWQERLEGWEEELIRREEQLGK